MILALKIWITLAVIVASIQAWVYVAITLIEFFKKGNV